MTEDNNGFSPTGRMVPVEYDKLVNIVFQAMDKYVDSKVKGNEGYELNPLKKSVMVVKKNGQILQVPNIIQQDAITLYFEKKPDVAKYLENEYMDYDSGDSYGDSYGGGNDHNERQKSTDKTLWIFIILVIIVVITVIYFAGRKNMQ